MEEFWRVMSWELQTFTNWGGRRDSAGWGAANVPVLCQTGLCGRLFVETGRAFYDGEGATPPKCVDLLFISVKKGMLREWRAIRNKKDEQNTPTC